jgi:CRISPR-associated protein Csn2
MRLVHPNWEYQIEFQENRLNTLVIESPMAMCRYIQELLLQSQGEEGLFVLSEKDELLNIAKELTVIIDPFSLDFNQRKIISKIITQIKDLAVGEDLFCETNEILSKLLQYAADLEFDMPFPLQHNESIEIVDVIKILGFRLSSEQPSLTEKLTDYFEVLRTFCGISCFVLCNMKSFLSDVDFLEFHKQVSYGKFNVLLLENMQREPFLSEEVRCIIDKDLCEIY